MRKQKQAKRRGIDKEENQGETKKEKDGREEKSAAKIGALLGYFCLVESNWIRFEGWGKGTGG